MAESKSQPRPKINWPGRDSGGNPLPKHWNTVYVRTTTLAESKSQPRPKIIGLWWQPFT